MPNEIKSVLVVGGTRGLGLELAKQYASKKQAKVYATARKPPTFDDNDKVVNSIHWLVSIDVATESAGREIVSQAGDAQAFDLVIIGAGYFGKESFDEPSWDAQLTMYKTSAMGPVFVTHHLVKQGLLHAGSRVILVSSEAGSIGLRHEKEGGGMYGHHASKAALNMAGKLLSLDLLDKNIAVGLVHPGFMRTEMTRSVGFDKFWDEGGAVTPAEAAESLVSFIDTFDMSKTGQLWAPRGPADIGTAEETLGPKGGLPTPLQLPW